MEDMKLFVERMIRQTLEDMEYQKRTDPDDSWLRFLEGKLQAFRLVKEHVDRRTMQEKLH
jgi:hypothetical protein